MQAPLVYLLQMPIQGADTLLHVRPVLSNLEHRVVYLGIYPSSGEAYDLGRRLGGVSKPANRPCR